MPLGDQPRSEVHAGPHQRARRRHQARAVPPGEPHLLAGRVERDGQARPAPGPPAPIGSLLEEQPRLGVDERRGRAVGDGDALGYAGRARGEDDPRVVGRLRTAVGSGCVRRTGGVHPGAVRVVEVAVGVVVVVAGDRRGLRAGESELEVVADRSRDIGLAEHQLRPLVRVVGVHRDVRRPGLHRPEDRDVQIVVPRRDPHSDPVARPDPGFGETRGELGRLVQQFAISQTDVAVVQRRLIGVLRRRLLQHIHQRPRGWRQVTTSQRHGRILRRPVTR